MLLMQSTDMIKLRNIFRDFCENQAIQECCLLLLTEGD